MARSADDLAVALNILAGPDPDETGLRYMLPAPRTTSLKGLRVAVWSHEPGHETDTEAVAAIDAMAVELERFGCTVSRSARPAFDVTEAFHIFLQALDAGWSARATEEILISKRKRLATLDPNDMSADAVMARATDMPHREWLVLNERRMKFRRLWSAFFREWDVLLTPVINTVALPHMQEGETIMNPEARDAAGNVPRHIQTGPVWDREVSVNGRTIAYNDMCFWPGLVAGFHLPVTVVPIGLTKAGLPIGVQISGPIYGDRTTLMAASLFEQAGYAFRPPTLGTWPG
jgi:amidase